MKKVEGYYFPDYDKDCHSVIVGQSNDIDVVLKYVDNFSVCIQAGGNVGIWPKILSQYFNHVYTFEPDPQNWACMEANIHETNISMYNTCLSDKREKLKVLPPDDNHLFNCGALQVFPGDKEAIVLDDLDIKNCGLIYLDIEGYELKALKGAINIITQFKPVIAFEDKKLPLMYDKQVGDVEKWLEQFGYKVAEKIHRDVICIPSS